MLRRPVAPSLLARVDCWHGKPERDGRVKKRCLWLVRKSFRTIRHKSPLPIPPVLPATEAGLPGIGPVNVGNFVVGSLVTGCPIAVPPFTPVHVLAVFFPEFLPSKTTNPQSSP